MQKLDLKNLKKKKIALVLSGGVVKAAAWHLGVTLALKELGLDFAHNKNTAEDNLNPLISTYVGSSAGSLICLFLACGLGPSTIIESQLNVKDPPFRPISYREMLSLRRPRLGKKNSFQDPLEGLPLFVKKILGPFIKIDGIFSTYGIRNYLHQNIINSNLFEEYKADLFIVATKLDESTKCIFSKYNYPSSKHDAMAHYVTGIPVTESIAASMSVPPLYAPYPIKNPYTQKIEYFIDGEIRDTLSTHVAMDNGCDFIISSWTHTPYHYHDEVGSLVNYGLPAICLQSIYLMIQKKIITARNHRQNGLELLDIIRKYMIEEKFTSTQIEKILSIIENKLHYRKDVTLLDIYPKYENYKMFFSNTFSLSPKKTAMVVSMGYKRTFEIFKKFEWDGL